MRQSGTEVVGHVLQEQRHTALTVKGGLSGTGHGSDRSMEECDLMTVRVLVKICDGEQLMRMRIGGAIGTLYIWQPAAGLSEMESVYLATNLQDTSSGQMRKYLLDIRKDLRSDQATSGTKN